jgi:hypothetical protein
MLNEKLFVHQRKYIIKEQLDQILDEIDTLSKKNKL